MDADRILHRLDELGGAKVGGPLPEWLDGVNNWAENISELAREAAKLIRETQESAAMGFVRGRV